MPLCRGVLISRYKRFMADVMLETGETVTAHCPNSGSMLTVCQPGSEVWLSAVTAPGRKLSYTWHLVRVGSTLVGVNTNHPNRLVAEAIARGGIAELAGYSRLRREVRYGHGSRIDILLEQDARPSCFVEIKNVTMRRNTAAGVPVEFPDAVTERGRRHLHDLAEEARRGARAMMLFLAQRDDCDRCAVAKDIDPAFANALGEAVDAGVEIASYRCVVSKNRICVSDRIEFVMP